LGADSYILSTGIKRYCSDQWRDRAGSKQP